MLNDLVSKVDDYLDRNVSLPQFKEWFFGVSFDIERQYSGIYADLVQEIQLILAEASSGSWSEIVLDRELDSVVAAYRTHPRITFIKVDDDSPATFISSVPWELLTVRRSAI